jgi:hypothetical protein
MMQRILQVHEAKFCNPPAIGDEQFLKRRLRSGKEVEIKEAESTD